MFGGHQEFLGSDAKKCLTTIRRFLDHIVNSLVATKCFSIHLREHLMITGIPQVIMLRNTQWLLSVLSSFSRECLTILRSYYRETISNC